MKFNKILIIVVIIMVAMTAINMYMTFANRLKIETVSYDSNYNYDYDGKVTMHSTMEVRFLKPKQIDDFLKQFDRTTEEKIADFQKSMDDFSKNLNRVMTVEDFQSEATIIGTDMIKIEEYSVISDFASRNGDEINTSLGDLKMELTSGAILTITLPPDAVVVSANPEPTSNPDSNILIWSNTGSMQFPEVIYKKGE